MEKSKVGFLFGAGAEISYGMPSGGKFALDIFRHSTQNSKDKLRDMITAINKRSDYAAYGLPKDFDRKNISAYGKAVYRGIIKDTIRNNKEKIIDNLNDFDTLAEKAARQIFRDKKDDPMNQLDSKIKEEIGPDVNVNQELQYNDLFKKGNDLFENQYFAAILMYYKDYPFECEDDRIFLGELIKSILQLQIGALSSNISSKVEDSVFEKDNLHLDLFDDLGGSLNVNYETAGIEGLNLLSEKQVKETSHCIVRLAYNIVENVYSNVLNYKSLIDSNWHYLYSPKTEWAKFSKIIVFLYTVQEYINEQAKNLNSSKSGYYTDLNEVIESGKFEVPIIGTSNYSSFISKILTHQKISFLNGGIDVYYDPYMNSLVDEKDDGMGHIIVPLMFTQSGTKPMTSIDMSKKYVDFYDALKDADKICSIGFGFNSDDDHINGVIRTLIERENKQLYIVCVDNMSKVNLRKMYARKLRISNENNIHIVQIDSNSRKVKDEDIMWYEKLE